MKKSFIRKVIDLSEELETRYMEDIRMKDTDFTRHRKITPQHLYLQMFANKGESQKNEIEDFFKDIRSSFDVSTTAFYNARMKFNPEALLKILQDLIKETYIEDQNLITLNGYYVCAVDGSDFILPSTPSNSEKYGVAKNQESKNGNTPVMSSISTIFDCINKLILDVKINPYSYSEQFSAREHLKRVKEILPPGSRMLCIFDRGYPSIRLIDQMIENNQKFLIRLRKNDFKEAIYQLSEQECDKWVHITYDMKKTNEFRRDFQFREKLLNTVYHLRFVRIAFQDMQGKETVEYLVTNLGEEEFDVSSIQELYHIRWDIETCYRSLKSQLRVEEFSGYRDILIRQDIYASAFVYNTISMTISENSKVQEQPSKRYQYEMKVNRNHAVGVLKRDFLEMFVLYRNKKAAAAAQKRFEEAIVKYACPVRKNRKYQRDKNVINKSKISYRRSY